MFHCVVKIATCVHQMYAANFVQFLPIFAARNVRLFQSRNKIQVFMMRMYVLVLQLCILVECKFIIKNCCYPISAI